MRNNPRQQMVDREYFQWLRKEHERLLRDKQLLVAQMEAIRDMAYRCADDESFNPSARDCFDAIFRAALDTVEET